MTRKTKALSDRSMKGHSPEVRFGSVPFLPQTKAIVERAGFACDVVDSVIEEIESALFWYKVSTESANQLPRLSAELPYLRQFVSLGTDLQQVLARMAPVTRRRIVDRDPAKPFSHINPRGSLIEKALSRALTRATNAILDIKDDGGAPRNDDFRALIQRLAVIWYKRQSSHSAVTRSGAGPRYGKAEYSGPLLDFAEAVLRFEGIGYTSRRGSDPRRRLGEYLFEARESATALANREISQNSQGRRRQGKAFKPMPLEKVLEESPSADRRKTRPAQRRRKYPS